MSPFALLLIGFAVGVVVTGLLVFTGVTVERWERQDRKAAEHRPVDVSRAEGGNA